MPLAEGDNLTVFDVDEDRILLIDDNGIKYQLPIEGPPPQPGDLGQFNHHPDPQIDANTEVERLQGLLAEAHAGLKRGLDFQSATAHGLAIKHDLRDTLKRTGYEGELGEVDALHIPPAKLGDFGKEFARQFSKLINNFSSTERDAALEVMMRDHRSIKQGMMRFFMTFVEATARDTHDGRNQAAVALAKRILEIENRSLPNI